ncbi:MAG: aminotransferase class III-fold pyridoxal phosphate-dependent enzyme, partial [Anaerolineales bacterium]|nr:aminotransferase class III-fold pyridoxal phosphate-dependent enzyme [Anaerolineales bacterium]
IYGMTETDIEEAKTHLMVGGGTPGPVLVGGKGVRVEDIDGNSYIDCTSQSWAMYLGFGNEEIRDVVYQHAGNLTHVHQGFDTLSRFYLARKLTEHAPEEMNRVSFTVGGGPAIEAAMKIALKNRPGAKEFISLWDAYHGTIFSAASASWIATQASGGFTGQQHFLPMLHTVHRVPNPYCYRCYFGQKPESCNLMCAEMLRLTLERGVNGPAAAFILEPIQASGGQIIAPKRYLERVREICDQYGVLLVFDEIQTYCRCGDWFAAGHFGVTPDVIVLGKGLGAGLPIAAIIIRDGLEGFSLKAEELHTFANNSASQVAAAKQIEVIERDNLLKNTREMGAYLAEGLRALQPEFPEMGDIRALGLHIGVEYENPQTKEPRADMAVGIRDEGLKLGAIFGLGGARKNVLKVKPPLIVTRGECDDILRILRQSMQRALRQ